MAENLLIWSAIPIAIVLICAFSFLRYIGGRSRRPLRRDNGALWDFLYSAGAGQWTVMVLFIEPKHGFEPDSAKGKRLQRVVMRRLTRLHRRKNVFNVGEGLYVVLVEWKGATDPERAGRDLAQRTRDALTNDLTSRFPGLPAALGYTGGEEPHLLIKRVSEAARRAAGPPAAEDGIPIVPLDREETGRTSTD